MNITIDILSRAATAGALCVLISSARAIEPRALLQTHCLNCHSTEKQKGDLDLEASDIQKEPHIWENVLEQIEMGEMPPKKEKQFSTEEKKHLTDWVRGTLDRPRQCRRSRPRRVAPPVEHGIHLHAS